MSFDAQVLRVFIASPGDLGTDRDDVEAAIHQWNRQHAARNALVLMPQRWEGAAAAQGGDGQHQINEQQVRESDIVLAMFYTRLGEPTSRALSGTAEEIELGEQFGKPTHVLVCEREINPASVDMKEYAKLQDYIGQLRERGLTKSYGDGPGLRAEVDNVLWAAIDRIRRTASTQTGAAEQNPASPTAGSARANQPTAVVYATNLRRLSDAVPAYKTDDSELDPVLRKLTEFADTVATVTESARVVLALVLSVSAADGGMSLREVARRTSLPLDEVQDLAAELGRYKLAYFDAETDTVDPNTYPGVLDWPFWDELLTLEAVAPGTLHDVVVDLRFDRLDKPPTTTRKTSGTPTSNPSASTDHADNAGHADPPDTDSHDTGTAPSAAEHDTLTSLIDRAQLSDPLPETLRESGHLYLVATPTPPQPRLARTLLRSDGLGYLRDLIGTRENRLPSDLQQVWPPAEFATRALTNPRTVGFVSEGPVGDAVLHGTPLPEPGHDLANGERRFVSITLDEDAALSITVGRLTDIKGDQNFVLDVLAVAYASRLVHYTAALAERLGYDGPWLLGAAGTDLRGAMSTRFSNRPDLGRRYAQDDYTEGVRVTHHQLQTAGPQAVEDLVGGLSFALGTSGDFANHVNTAFS